MPVPVVASLRFPHQSEPSSSSRRSGTSQERKKTPTRPWRRRSSRADAVPLRRRTTSSVSHMDAAEEEQGEYYSWLDESSDDESGSDPGWERRSEVGDLGLGLGLGEDDIPVTGFAVASNRRNLEFHELFPGIPEGDYLIKDYGCALQREILVQGRLYVSENHICFRANIFGWVTDLSIPIYEITTLEKRMTAFVIPNAIRVGTPRTEYTFASFLSRDTTFDVVHNIWRLARPGDAASIGSGSMDIVEGTIIGGDGTEGPRRPTQCACGKDGSHFTETAMNTIVPGTPDRIYDLMFASGFMKDFMAANQKLRDIQVSDWAPASPGSTLLARNVSFVKPLNAPMGPRQTKCEIREETVHVDFDDYVSTLTTTRTPDVPGGGIFAVKTRTCLMWAAPLATKIVVTTQVDWTGRSFIKGLINSSALDGQKVYHTELEKAMRAYIQEHQSEFILEGMAPPEIEPPVDVAPLDPPSEKKGEQKRNRRGCIADFWESSTSTTILYALIGVLVVSNVWTYVRVGSTVDGVGRKMKEPAKVGQCAGVTTGKLEVNVGGSCQSGCC